MKRALPACLCLLLSCVSLAIGQAGTAPDPGFTRQFDTANSAYKQGDYRKAVEGFKKANKLEGNSCYACCLGVAISSWKLRDYKNAIEFADKAIGLAKSDRDGAVAHNLRGNVLLARAQSDKDFSGAEDEYRRAIQLDPATPNYHLNCASALIRQSKDEAARRELQACLAANPAPEIAKRAQLLLADPRRGREEFAPEFKVKALSGEELSLEQFKGKVLVMDFWATWCPPCRASVGELKELTRKYPPDKLVLFSISADSDDDSWRKFVEKKHMDWMQYRDSDHQLLDAFGVHSFPTYLVIDGDGIIRQRLTGMNPQETVVHRLRATLESMQQLSH